MKTPTPWTIYDTSDPLKIGIKGFDRKLGGMHVATVIMPENAALIVEVVNSHETMVEALKAIEFRGHQGKCPLCAGWDMSPSGETPGKHTKDCLVGKALDLVGSPKP